MNKIKGIITSHGIQVTKASVNRRNGNVYIDLPSNENRDKLVPLLTEQAIPVVHLKQKCPMILIRGVCSYVSEDDFVEKVKSQNPQIKEKLENGLEFSVVFTK